MVNNYIEIDKPIKSKEEDKIYYSKIYQPEFQNLIENNTQSLKIGLFGSYGTGKSSIIELVKKEFNETNESKFVHFSVWGYSSIEIIRKILTEINKKCLGSDYHELYEERTTIDSNSKLSSQIWFAGSLIIFIIISLFLELNFKSTSFQESITLKVVVALIPVSLAFYFGINAIDKINKKQPLKTDEFQRYWLKLLKKIKKNKIKKIILVVDDLDRCEIKTINKVLEKLNTLIPETNGICIKVILPFSIDKYILDENFNQLYDNTKKLLDTIIWMPNSSKLNLYRMTKGSFN